jgi:hypothetical protein
MTGRIQNCEASMLSIKEPGCYFDGNTPLPLFICLIHDVSKFESSFTVLLCQLEVLSKLLLVDFTKLKKQMTCEGGLTGVNMANNDDVYIIVGWLLI